MCYVFLQAETFALRGGPAGTGATSVIGSYSGVLIDTGTTQSSNMGLFLLNAAGAGASSGQLVIFSSSNVGSDSYNCNMTGLSDSSKGGSGKLLAIFSGPAVEKSAGSSKSISGRMTCQTSSTTAKSSSRRLGGNANSATLTVITSIAATGTTSVNADGTLNTSLNYSGTLIGPQVSYTVDGWQTIGTPSGVGLVLQ